MPSTLDQRTPTSKALRVNLDPAIYGTFAEIGAGQEVARHFFLAGKASQTIAKTISAYDMVYSDEIYGKEKNGRYVCEPRLNKMLDKEFSLLIRRLDEVRGDKTKFFAFASTVATGSAETPRCHGWMGVRFQTKPKGPINDIILHVRMLDRYRLSQQEALGVLGVNLVEAAFFGTKNYDTFLTSLTEGLKPGQIAIDLVRFSGEDLKSFDDRILNIQLVKRGLAEAILFDANQKALHVGDAIYGKNILLQRGFFAPLTLTHLEVMKKGSEQFKSEFPDVKKTNEILPIYEINLPSQKGHTKDEDLLERLEGLAAQGVHSLFSGLPYFYQVKSFFRKYTAQPFVIVMSANYLKTIFDPKYYGNLEGGLLEGFGKLLEKESKIFIYPHKTDKECLTAKVFNASKDYNHIYHHFLDNGQIKDISTCDAEDTYHHSGDVQKLIEKKDKKWESMVTPEMRTFIKARKVFGYKT